MVSKILIVVIIPFAMALSESCLRQSGALSAFDLDSADVDLDMLVNCVRMEMEEEKRNMVQKRRKNKFVDKIYRTIRKIVKRSFIDDNVRRSFLDEDDDLF